MKQTRWDKKSRENNVDSWLSKTGWSETALFETVTGNDYQWEKNFHASN